MNRDVIIVTFEEELPDEPGPCGSKIVNSYYQPTHVFSDKERAWDFAISLFKRSLSDKGREAHCTDGMLRAALQVEGFLASMDHKDGSQVIVRLDEVGMD